MVTGEGSQGKPQTHLEEGQVEELQLYLSPRRITEKILLKAIYKHKNDKEMTRNSWHAFFIMFFNANTHYLYERWISDMNLWNIFFNNI